MQKLIFSNTAIDKFVKYLSTKERSIPVASKNSCCQKEIFCNRFSTKILNEVQGKYFRIVVQYNATPNKDAAIETYIGFIANGKASKDGKKTTYQNGPIVYYLGYDETIYIPFCDLHLGFVNIKLDISDRYLKYFVHVSILNEEEFNIYSNIVLPKFEERVAPNIQEIINMSDALIENLSSYTKEVLTIFKVNPNRENSIILKYSLDSSWSHKNEKGEYVWPKEAKWRGNNMKIQLQKFYGVVGLQRELLKML